MLKLLPTGLGIVVVVIVVLAIIDVVTEPEGANCILDNNMVLPDRCFVVGCEEDDFCPAATTRPYLIFWEEAATCPTGRFLCSVAIP